VGLGLVHFSDAFDEPPSLQTNLWDTLLA